MCNIADQMHLQSKRFPIGSSHLPAVRSAYVCVCWLDLIPTFVTEMGETLMNELDESEVLSAVESLEGDQWSSAASSSLGELAVSSQLLSFCRAAVSRARKTINQSIKSIWISSVGAICHGRVNRRRR